MKIPKRIKTFFSGSIKKDEKEISCDTKERELLKTKVIKGTDFAVREYGEVFKKLAEYDRTLN
ncbi:MAG: hypothetical protein PHO19_02770 [Candidatus Pacebacteria bacterium]|nr:hypothetical protein [Candidatus Paceibacterota bacterium]